MKRQVLSVPVLSCALLSASPAPSESPPSELTSGIVYGKNHAFMLSAPKGWVLDNTSGVSQGLHAVFYPVGSSWEESVVVMYANVIHKGARGRRTLQEVIASDEARFRTESPRLVVRSAPTMRTGDGKPAAVKHFSGDRFGNWEAVAYVDEAKVVAVITMTSRKEKPFRESLRAFERLVASYHFMTDQVRLPPKR